jgi:hypothetical protein
VVFFFPTTVGLRFIPDPMNDSPIRFSNRDLAERIATQNGGTVRTVKVTMVGQEDVSKLLKKIKAARGVAPSNTFRVK